MKVEHLHVSILCVSSCIYISFYLHLQPHQDALYLHCTMDIVHCTLDNIKTFPFKLSFSFFVSLARFSPPTSLNRKCLLDALVTCRTRASFLPSRAPVVTLSNGFTSMPFPANVKDFTTEVATEMKTTSPPDTNAKEGQLYYVFLRLIVHLSDYFD